MGIKLNDIPFCAISDLPLAGKPTMTTQICVSSTWTPWVLTRTGRANDMMIGRGEVRDEERRGNSRYAEVIEIEEHDLEVVA